MDTPRQCASNKLYHGEARDFREALRLHMQCYLDEIQACRHDARKQGRELDSEDDTFIQEFKGYLARAQKAREQYEAHDAEWQKLHQAHLKVLADEWRATGDEILEPLADALESGDYSQLAI